MVMPWMASGHPLPLFPPLLPRFPLAARSSNPTQPSIINPVTSGSSTMERSLEAREYFERKRIPQILEVGGALVGCSCVGEAGGCSLPPGCI